VRISVHFLPTDIVVGVFVAPPDYASLTQETYVYPLPCLAILFTRKVPAFR
jgi:hypothetical protein